jgi:hypothetical protein
MGSKRRDKAEERRRRLELVETLCLEGKGPKEITEILTKEYHIATTERTVKGDCAEVRKAWAAWMVTGAAEARAELVRKWLRAFDEAWDSFLQSKKNIKVRRGSAVNTDKAGNSTVRKWQTEEHEFGDVRYFLAMNIAAQNVARFIGMAGAIEADGDAVTTEDFLKAAASPEDYRAMVRWVKEKLIEYAKGDNGASNARGGATV